MKMLSWQTALAIFVFGCSMQDLCIWHAWLPSEDFVCIGRLSFVASLRSWNFSFFHESKVLR